MAAGVGGTGADLVKGRCHPEDHPGGGTGLGTAGAVGLAEGPRTVPCGAAPEEAGQPGLPSGSRVQAPPCLAPAPQDPWVPPASLQ